MAYDYRWYKKYRDILPEKTQYQMFQEWLNDCPVEMTNYLDYTDTFEVTFKVELEREGEI